MASDYSSTLRLELIGTGDQSGLWGDTTNTNLGSLIEQAITGVDTIPMVDADYTLSALNGSVDEARNVGIIMTSIGSLTGSRNIIIPAVEKTYFFKNATTGGQNIVVKTSGGTGVAVPNGQTVAIYCDGTNCAFTTSFLPDLTVTNLTATNLTLGSGATGTGSYVRQTSPTINTPTIAGGTITGITDLAVADGGTGASDASTARDNLGLTIGTNVPSPTGTGASGTWNINITGTAAQATNATNVNGGNVACNGIQVTSGAPTIWMYDTDQADFAMHVNSNLWYILNQGGGGIMYVDQSGNFTAAGNVTAYSDERLKTGVVTFQNALDTVDQMRGVAFVKDDKPQVGVIAQEMQRVLPQVVQENADGYLSVAYGNIVGVLIEAIKELRAEVKTLKGE